MLYVYGVVRAGHPPPDVAGIGRPPAPVRLVTSGRLAAAVSELPAEQDLGEDDARIHLRVLIELLSAGAVLPLRLGTVAADEPEVAREVLDSAADQLFATLDRLDGLVELQLDVDDDEAEVLAVLAASRGGAAAGTDLAERLEVGRQVALDLMDHRQAVAERIVTRLRHLAVDDVARATITGPEDPVLRWAFLVRADDLPLFDEAVVALRSEEPGLSVRYVGPLPAAHFVDRAAPRAEDREDSFHGNGSWGW